jgi:adenosylcobinamide-GDP ribazoletransferase
MIRNAFAIAVQFLTRWPVHCEWSPRAAGLSLLFYPLVGLLIGGVLWLLSLLLVGGDLLASALLVSAWVLMTGALHLDGLADSADAWVGGYGDRERTLAIMKDPYAGPVGVTALILVLGLKWSAVAGLLAEGDLLGLVLAPVLARTAVLALFYSTPYAREQGLGAALAQHLPRREAARVLLAVGALTVLAGGRDGIWLLLAAFVALVLLRAMMMRRLGGTTGDTAGATIELVEVAVLAAYAL